MPLYLCIAINGLQGQGILDMTYATSKSGLAIRNPVKIEVMINFQLIFLEITINNQGHVFLKSCEQHGLKDEDSQNVVEVRHFFLKMYSYYEKLLI